MWPHYTVAGWVLVPLIGLAFIGFGYTSLVKWIPNSPTKDALRTDFLSARASYWMIGVGLVMVVLWAAAAVLVRSLAMLKSLRVI